MNINLVKPHDKYDTGEIVNGIVEKRAIDITINKCKEILLENGINITDNEDAIKFIIHYDRIENIKIKTNNIELCQKHYPILENDLNIKCVIEKTEKNDFEIYFKFLDNLYNSNFVDLIPELEMNGISLANMILNINNKKIVKYNIDNNDKYKISSFYGLNARNYMNGTIETVLYYGEDVNVISYNGLWAKIRYENDIYYVPSNYLSKELNLSELIGTVRLRYGLKVIDSNGNRHKVPYNEKVKIIKIEKDKCYVKYNDIEGISNIKFIEL